MIKRYLKFAKAGFGAKGEPEVLNEKLLPEAEWRYLGNYPDAAEGVDSGRYPDVFDFHQKTGRRKGYSLSNPDKLFIESIDVRWFNKKYHVLPDDASPKDIVKAYLLGVKENRYSPNESFDEEIYLETYPDVEKAVSGGGFVSGFEHYVILGSKESRATQSVFEGEKSESYKRMMELERRIPGVTTPVGIQRIDNIKRVYYKNYPIEWRNGSDKRLVALIPHLDPDILFGGYRAFFEFIKVLQSRGVVTHFAVFEPTVYENNYAMLSELKSKAPDIYEIVTKYLPPTMCSMGGRLEIGAGDRIIAYSSSTARVASQIVKSNKLPPFYFFIQEFEPVFHAGNSTYFVTAEPFYYSNYKAIFNSNFLHDYFISNSIGNKSIADGESYVFEHAIRKSPIDRAKLASRKNKKFIFYARPESHAERNLFEVCVCALEKAVLDGVFGADWSFTGVGTLGTYAQLDLPFGRKLDLIPKLAGKDYYRELQEFDAGMSLILTPHPGVVHYEFARAGIPTVTNTYFNRSKEQMAVISKNIIGAELNIDSIVEAIRKVVFMSCDIEQRVANAEEMTNPTCWDESYSSIADAIALDILE